MTPEQKSELQPHLVEDTTGQTLPVERLQGGGDGRCGNYQIPPEQ